MREGVGGRTVQVCHQLVSRVLRQAVAEGIIDSNPAAYARPPAVKRGPIRILTPAQVESLADGIDPRYTALVFTGAHGGLRFGEAAALRRGHVRTLQRKIDVEEGLVEVRGELIRGPLKTKESRRTVSIPPFLADAPAEHMARFPDPAGSDLIFTAPGGGPIRRTNWRRRFWLPAVQTAGITPSPKYHHLRHTATALAIAQGAHPRAIQARLGHASITTALNLYGGLFLSLDEALADGLELVRAAATAEGLRNDSEAEVIAL